MTDARIRLAGLWVAVMLTYLLGDVLRIYAGDYEAGQVGGVEMSQATWLAVAVVMAVPILMLVLTVLIDRPLLRWLHVIAAMGLFAFNAIGLPTYPGLYDQFLIVLGLVFNGLTVVVAMRRA